METRAHHVVIGLFTLIVVSAALLFCLWLTNSGDKTELVLEMWSRVKGDNLGVGGDDG